MKLGFLYFTAFAFANLSFGQQPSKTSNPDDVWTIKWSVTDEFSGEQPDWQKWNKAGGLPDANSWTWNNEQNVTIENGFARLTLRHNEGNKPIKNTYFQSGILKSYRTFTHGYFEARIRGAAFPGPGVCPSFWLYSDFDDDGAEGETIYSEIDVVELQQLDWYEGKQDDARDMDLNLHCIVKAEGKRSWRRPKVHPQEQLNKW